MHPFPTHSRCSGLVHAHTPRSAHAVGSWTLGSGVSPSPLGRCASAFSRWDSLSPACTQESSVSSECSLGVCNSCGEEAKNRSPDVQRRKETPVAAHPPPPHIWLPPARQDLETPMESKAKGWAPVRERHPWPDSGAGGVSGDLVQAASRSKRAKGAPGAPTRCDEGARRRRRTAPGRAGGSGRNRDGDRASPLVSTLRALGGCSLPRWTG